MRQFAITDIHGCRLTFEALLAKIALTTSDELFLLGDYIDRGPDSKGVIDLILGMREIGYTVHCLRGNHEQMFLDIAATPPEQPFSLYPGLVDTLNSYASRHPANIPQAHLEFMSSLEYYREADNYLLVHGGLNFTVPDPLNDLDAMLWERDWHEKIDKTWLGNRIILHGHTPTKVEEIHRQYDQLGETCALILDNGCVYNAEGLNQLAAFDMTNRELHFQKNVEN